MVKIIRRLKLFVGYNFEKNSSLLADKVFTNKVHDFDLDA